MEVYIYIVAWKISIINMVFHCQVLLLQNDYENVQPVFQIQFQFASTSHDCGVGARFLLVKLSIPQAWCGFSEPQNIGPSAETSGHQATKLAGVTGNRHGFWVVLSVSARITMAKRNVQSTRGSRWFNMLQSLPCGKGLHSYETYIFPSFSQWNLDELNGPCSIAVVHDQRVLHPFIDGITISLFLSIIHYC